MADDQKFADICISQGWEHLDDNVWFKASEHVIHDENGDTYPAVHHWLIKRLPSGEVIYAENCIAPEAWANADIRLLCMKNLRITLDREEARRG